MAHSTALNDSDKSPTANHVTLLEQCYGEYFTPLTWDMQKNASNYFARIRKGIKTLFERDFLRSSFLDEQVIFRKEQFPEGEIIELKSIYTKGSKKETTFQGFFIIHHIENKICGEEISQKHALEYFDCKKELPNLNSLTKDEPKAQLRVKIGTIVRKLASKYGEAVIADVLISIVNDLFPECKPNS
jgi:hypothetical protein